MWTEAEIKIAINLRDRGITAAEISILLKKTKSAVLNKIYRRKYANPGKGALGHRHAKLPPKSLLGAMPKTGCKWHTDGLGWCSEATIDGKPYCQAHNKRSLLDPQPKMDIDGILKSLRY